MSAQSVSIERVGRAGAVVRITAEQRAWHVLVFYYSTDIKTWHAFEESPAYLGDRAVSIGLPVTGTTVFFRTEQYAIGPP